MYCNCNPDLESKSYFRWDFLLLLGVLANEGRIGQTLQETQVTFFPVIVGQQDESTSRRSSVTKASHVDDVSLHECSWSQRKRQRRGSLSLIVSKCHAACYFSRGKTLSFSTRNERCRRCGRLDKTQMELTVILWCDCSSVFRYSCKFASLRACQNHKFQ